MTSKIKHNSKINQDEPLLIASMDQLIENLNTVESYLNSESSGDDFEEMAVYIARGKTFVAYFVDKQWHFAQSRFIGYIDNTLEKHRDNVKNKKVDGKETDKELGKLFKTKEVFDETLEDAYLSYCDTLNVKPRNYVITHRNYWKLDEDVSEDITVEHFSEGTLQLKKHLKRERNQRVVRAAKELFKKSHKGHLYCEVCGFDFEERYGTAGHGFIEAHHKVPISQVDGVHDVTVDDFAMVCPNCHRMLHKTDLSINELRKLLKK